MILPDQAHINQVRERLWSGGEYGRAAIMVGSGFSRNSDPVSDNVAPFPLWNDLARLMQEALHPDHTVSPTGSQPDPLRLASEMN